MNFIQTYATAPLKLSDETFRQLRDHIYALSGIYFQDNKKYLLEGRLSKRVHLLNLDSFEDYLNHIRNGRSNQAETQHLFDAVTINETFFFRNEPQFEALEKMIIPEIIRSRQINHNRRMRIWSSASSSGEEAYTIAMLFQEKIKPRYPGLEIEIIGTDINASVIEIARRGIYREYSVRNMHPYYLQKYFTSKQDRYILNDNIKRMVRFERLNLYDQNKMRQMINYDVIYCCNVLIYFDMNSKIQVISNLYNSMNQGGYLFIGYAESLHGITNAFKLVNYPKTVAYKKE